MSDQASGRRCEWCGQPGLRLSQEHYCSKSCAAQIADLPCPVTGCTSSIRRSTLVVCPCCWARVPYVLRDRLTYAHEAFHQADLDDYSERLAELNQAKELVIAAAEGHVVRFEEKRERARAKAAARLKEAA